MVRQGDLVLWSSHEADCWLDLFLGESWIPSVSINLERETVPGANEREVLTTEVREAGRISCNMKDDVLTYQTRMQR